MKPLVFLFALFVAMAVGSAAAQNLLTGASETSDQQKARLKTENERLQAENQVLRQKLDQLKVVLGLNAADIEQRYEQASALFNDGNAADADMILAQNKMNQAYAAFERLRVQSGVARVRYLRLLFDLADALQENEKTIEHAIDLALYASEDSNKAFAYNALGRTYGGASEHDMAIFYFQKALVIYAKDTESEYARLSEANCYLSIGSIHGLKGDSRMAQENWVKAKEIYLITRGAADPGTKHAQELIDQLKTDAVAPPAPRGTQP